MGLGQWTRATMTKYGDHHDDPSLAGAGLSIQDAGGVPGCSRAHAALLGAAVRAAHGLAERGRAPALPAGRPDPAEPDARRDRDRATRRRCRPLGPRDPRRGTAGDGAGPRDPGRVAVAGRRCDPCGSRPCPRRARTRIGDRRGRDAGDAPGRCVVGDRPLRRGPGAPHDRGGSQLAGEDGHPRAGAGPRRMGPARRRAPETSTPWGSRRSGRCWRSSGSAHES